MDLHRIVCHSWVVFIHFSGHQDWSAWVPSIHGAIFPIISCIRKQIVWSTHLPPPLQNKSAYFITKNLHHSSSNSCNPDKASFLDYRVMRRTWCIFQSHYSVVYALPWYPTQAPSQVHSCHMLPLIFIISAIMHLLLNRILALGTCPLW